MLFLLFGSSGVGKTHTLELVRDRLKGVVCHEFDELEVPRGADTAWRQHANEKWLQRALADQAEGRDLLLVGQIPFGELLASPSAPLLEAISACLLDCDDETQLARLRARGPEWLEHIGAPMENYIRWATWLRHHVQDPGWMGHVIRTPTSPAEMRWDRWADWQAGDPRWRVHVVDTSATSPEDVADNIAQWIETERKLFASGEHPLAAWAS